MKKLLISLIFVLTFICGYGQIATPSCDYFDEEWPTSSLTYLNCDLFESGDWVLVFSDEYDDDEIDTDVWHTCSDGWQREHTPNAVHYMLDENVVLDNGLLKLTVDEQPGYYTVWRWINGIYTTTQKWFDYTSAWTQTKMNFKYGRFEVKCWIPEGYGLWPAFWFWGEAVGDKTIEIDVFEFNGDMPYKHNMNIIGWNLSSDERTECHIHDWYSVLWHLAPHTFSLEWDEFKLVFRVDNEIVRIDYTWFDMVPHGLYNCESHAPGFYAGPNPYRPPAPSDIRLGMGISGGEFGPPPNSNTEFPNYFYVDYIRVWRRNNSNKDFDICDVDFTNKSSYRTGNSFSLGGGSCNTDINDGEFLSLFAAEEILHLPGFHAKPGSYYSAQIYSNTTDKSQQTPSEASRQDSQNKTTSITNGNEILIEDCKRIEKANDDNNSTGDVSIFPNPSNGNFSIKYDGQINDILRIQIYNSNSQCISDVLKPTGNKVNFNLINLPSGIYTVRIITQSHTINKLLIMI